MKLRRLNHVGAAALSIAEAVGTQIFFVHRRDMGAVLTEIMESPKDAGH